MGGVVGCWMTPRLSLKRPVSEGKYEKQEKYNKHAFLSCKWHDWFVWWLGNWPTLLGLSLWPGSLNWRSQVYSQALWPGYKMGAGLRWRSAWIFCHWTARERCVCCIPGLFTSVHQVIHRRNLRGFARPRKQGRLISQHAKETINLSGSVNQRVLNMLPYEQGK